MSSKLSIQAMPVDPTQVEYQELVPDYPDDGLEYPDATPVAVPSRHGFISEGDRLRQLIVSELSQQRADAAGIDSPEEADDFDVPDEDDFFPVSVHQMEEDFDHLGIPLNPPEQPPEEKKEGFPGDAQRRAPPENPGPPEADNDADQASLDIDEIVTLPDGRKAIVQKP